MNTRFHTKTSSKEPSAARDGSSAAADAAAIAPPAYGIDFVDRGMSAAAPIQRVGKIEEEETLEKKVPLQRQTEPAPVASPNDTGMPDGLKTGVESLSGMDLSDVRVHANSDKPAKVDALAYAQGDDIYLARGQEAHLPHEAWHVVQQRQGRVKPTLQTKGAPINDDPGLEREADVMGERARRAGAAEGAGGARTVQRRGAARNAGGPVIQAVTYRNDDEDQVNGEYDIDDVIDGFYDLRISDTSPFDSEEPTSKSDAPNPFSVGFGTPTYTPPLQSGYVAPSYTSSAPVGFGGLSPYNSLGYAFGQPSSFPLSPSAPLSTYPPQGGFANYSGGMSFASLSSPGTSVVSTPQKPEDGEPMQHKADPRVIQRGVATRSKDKGAPAPASYVGMFKATGGGGHPHVPTSDWQERTDSDGTDHKYYNESDGTLEFTGKLSALKGGPGIKSHYSVNIEDPKNSGKMKFTGRKLVNSRYQHFLVANIAYEGLEKTYPKKQPKNKGNSPPGYTWHHHKKKGWMELVDREVHGLFGHHGGYSIWGGK